MAARRLLIIMVVLLTISTLAAALVPPPQENQESSSTTTSTSTTTEAKGDRQAKADDLIRSEVPVPKGDQAPRQIDVEPGDQLELTVTSGDAGEVSVPDFGLVEFAGPGNPATFNILLEEEDEFPVRFAGSGVVATIISKPERPKARKTKKDGK